ncbi:putative nuclease HARBI1 [Lineus longissimus]|uniref:putative nuclease HARBI1 n=1 Tax=Lineus longissimus TaxID=88925 RepID=UPI00315DC689
MAAALVVIEEENQRAIRRERVFRDRVHPLDEFNDDQLFRRYRLTRPIILEVIDLIGQDVEHPTRRSHAIPSTLQVLTALRYYATGSLQLATADMVHVSQPTVSRIITGVSEALVNRARQFISFPHDLETQERISEGFYTRRNRIPNVLGCIDGSLVAVRSPTQNEEAYVCRKGFHALNIQGVCSPDLKFTDIVARWPRSTHDAFIWSNSELNRGIGHAGFLLGDKAYPLRSWLLTPVRNPADAAERRYNAHHRRVRSVIERAFGRWKMRWLCLNREGNAC